MKSTSEAPVYGEQMTLTEISCPHCGGSSVGTVETIPNCVAWIAGLDADGQIEYAGETRVNWDGQYTETTEEGLSRLWCDSCYREFTDPRVRPPREDPPPERPHRYALFAGEEYYPSGGWRDFKRSCARVKDTMPTDEDTFSREWWQVVDLQTGQVMASYEPYPQPFPDAYADV